MSFTDYPYYLCISLLLIFLIFIKKDYRWFFLLLFSVIFYAYGRWEYLLLLITSISIDYVCAIKIENSESSFNRRLWLTLSLLTNLGILFFFKYFAELYGNWPWIETRVSMLGWQFENLVLPLGISFYTLQSMGYTIDVYRKEMKAERHFGYFSLYVSFFPQLIAGPIERPQRLLPQLRKPRSISTEKIQSGLFLIVFGLFKKLVVADRLFVLLNDSLLSPNNLLGWQAVSFGTIAFTAVYLDISAYTDIARGSARLFGIELSINFNRPMISRSIGEFWQRWHISLTSWIMNYLFKPLAQLHPSKIYRNFCLFVTFLIIGMWHGPTLPFILMGAVHGSVIVLERVVANNGYIWPKTKLFNFLRILRTHVFLNITGVLFLSPTMDVALDIYRQILNFELFFDISLLREQLHGRAFLLLLICGGATLIVVDLIKNSSLMKGIRTKTLPGWSNYSLIYLLFFVVIAFSERRSDEFFYFIF